MQPFTMGELEEALRNTSGGKGGPARRDSRTNQIFPDRIKREFLAFYQKRAPTAPPSRATGRRRRWWASTRRAPTTPRELPPNKHIGSGIH
eukprot:1116850-Alexandrium_andersonii.AAC.1